MLRALACLVFLAASAPQSRPPESFEKVDPYTRGEKDEIARAGYESLGPFRFAEDLQTKDIEETIGTRLLWVETAHFKLGSLLGTYTVPPDDREKEKLRDELGRLAKKLPRVRRESGKLDPWLRLHLYAQRLEEQYSDFLSRFGLREEEFPALAKNEIGPMGRGPYLGQESKFTVLLTAKSSQLARFLKRYCNLEELGSYRTPLPGGTWFFGTSAETLKNLGTELDSALHGLLAEQLARNLCDGLRGGQGVRSPWFTHGLGLWYQRRIEERWNVDVPRVSPGNEDDSWRWEPRLSGLVANGFVPSWQEMLDWRDIGKLEARQHLTAWSRVGWLLAQEKADLRGFLFAISDPEEASSSGTTPAERDTRALKTGFGKTPAELDEAWRKWVQRKYPKR